MRNYRIYFFSQIVSVSGTWMQMVAQAWLVLRLAPSYRAGLDLGVVTALQFLPMLVFGTWGGLVVDRLDKRRVLFATQTTAGLLALALGLLTSLHAVHLWHVYLLATLLGFVNMIDNPARQTFVVEMVGRDNLPNAVTLNSVVMNSARVIGPAVGGALIAFVSLAVCFEANAASYLAVVAGLAFMRVDDLHRTERVRRGPGQLREGFTYVWRNPLLRDPLVLVAIVGTVAYNFQVVLALLAKFTFHRGAGAYSALTALMGGGAVVGGLIAASRLRPTIHRLTVVGTAFGALMGVVALAPGLTFALVAIVPMGAASVAFIATANATLQLRADAAMRGRVMALYAIAFLGTTPIGSPLVGWVSQATSPRLALGGGAAITVAACLVTLRRHIRTHAPVGTALTIEESEPGTELGRA